MQVGEIKKNPESCTEVGVRNNIEETAHWRQKIRKIEAMTGDLEISIANQSY